MGTHQPQPEWREMLQTLIRIFATAQAAVPDLSNAGASGVYAPNVNKLFVFGGEFIGSARPVNTTRIYDIATNTWSTGAPMPDVRWSMGSGYFNGKIYLVGGCSTNSPD